MLAHQVATVLEAVPEFVDRFVDLVESADGDPGAPAAFTELADFVASLISVPSPPVQILERCLAGVESVAGESEDGEELVAWSFLAILSPEDVARLSPWLGPRTSELAEDVVFDEARGGSLTPEEGSVLPRARAAGPEDLD